MKCVCGKKISRGDPRCEDESLCVDCADDLIREKDVSIAQRAAELRAWERRLAEINHRDGAYDCEMRYLEAIKDSQASTVGETDENLRVVIRGIVRNTSLGIAAGLREQAHSSREPDALVAAAESIEAVQPHK